MRFTLWLMLGLLLGASTLSAHEGDQQAIERLMRHTWERPEAPLDVGPVIVDEGYAVAGWTQGERGGRALLRRAESGWRVVICAGDALLEPATLGDAGLSPELASRLAERVSAAEQGIPVERRRQFALFEGTLRVDGHSGHSAH